MNTPKTGAKCTCKRGVQRDNCPRCEGTGMVIDFRAIHAANPFFCSRCWQHHPACQEAK